MSSLEKNTRIQTACLELEKALTAFEDETELNKKAKKEAEKLKELKNKLEDIKRQLDALSN